MDTSTHTHPTCILWCKCDTDSLWSPPELFSMNTHTRPAGEAARCSACLVSSVVLMQSSQTETKARFRSGQMILTKATVREETASQKADFTFYWGFLPSNQCRGLLPSLAGFNTNSRFIICNSTLNWLKAFFTLTIPIRQRCSNFYLHSQQLQETSLKFLLFRSNGETHTATIINKWPDL